MLLPTFVISENLSMRLATLYFAGRMGRRNVPALAREKATKRRTTAATMMAMSGTMAPGKATVAIPLANRAARPLPPKTRLAVRRRAVVSTRLCRGLGVVIGSTDPIHRTAI